MINAKRFLSFALLVCTLVNANAQTIQKTRKVVEIMPSQTFYLNGGNRATFGGKSRVWYNIQLPENTVEWYYSFTTTKGQDPTASIQLISQLTRMVDPTGFSAIATNAILTPSGAAVCDLYLMDRPNADKFLEKVDNWGGSYNYLVNGSRLNYKEGVVQVRDAVSGSYCLGFKNPSAVQGITITFEVVAIVEEINVAEKTETQTKAEIFAEMGWKAYERGEYDKCLELSKKALKVNPEIGWVNSNIGLVHLIKKDYITAIECYANAVAFFKKDIHNTKLYLDEAIKDLNNLVAKHGQVEGTKDIMDMLKMEYQKL